MAFNTDKLSYFHSFSKMPVQSGSNFADGTSLGNAINKSGHTVTASEVWASDIPYYGAMGSLDDIISKVQPYARKNDMCLVTTTGMTYIYDGAGNWSLVNADDATNKGKLVAGQLIKNAKDDVVLLYHKGETLTNLTAANNANTNSANNAARLWTTVGVDGKPCASRLVEQFVGPTDKALNGLASVSYSPSIANGTLVAGTNYYDYCFSGTILWAIPRTTATVIDCFEYVGEKVSDVVDTVSTQGTAIQNVKDQVDTISDALGLGSEIVGTTLGSRVTGNETALKVLLGLAEGDKVVASESIATTAANAVSAGLATGGNIATAIANAKQEALDAINAIQHFSVVIVPEGQKITDVSPLEENTIYLVSEDAADGSYVEYIAFKPTPESAVTYERIGTTKIDLDGYTTDAEHEALAERVTALDGETGRVAVVEGKVSTLEGQVETITSTDATKEGSIAKALADAKEYTDVKITTELAEGGSIASAIKTAKEQAIASAEVTVHAGTGIVVTGEGKGTEFTIAVSDEVATAAALSALTQTVASNKTELEGKITTAQMTLQGNIDDVAGRVTTLEDVTIPEIDGRLTDAENTIKSLTEGDSSIDNKIDAAKEELNGVISDVSEIANAAKATAESAVQSVTRAEGSSELITVTTEGTDVTISLSETVATKSNITDEIAKLTADGGSVKELQGKVSAIETDLATGATAQAITKAQETADAAKGIAETAVQTVTGDTYVTATKSETGVTLETQIGAIDSKLAEETSVVGAAINAAKKAGTDAAADVVTLSTTEVASQSVTGSGITVTLAGKVGAPTLAGSVETASYTAATETADGSWSNESNVVTGATVKDALTDVTNAHKKDIETLEQSIEEALEQHTADIETVTAAVNALSTSGFYRIVVSELPTENINLNAIYLIANKESDANEYIEYIYVGEVGAGRFEQIGTTKTDLKEYSTTEQMNSAIEGAIKGAIEILDVASSTQHGVTYSQTDGKISISVDAIGAITDSTATDENKLVTAGAVKIAINTLNEAISSKVAEVTGGSNGITISTAEKNADGKVVATLSVSTANIVDGDQIVASITEDDEDKFVTAAQILAAIKLAKPENYVAAIGGYSPYVFGEDNLISSTQGSSVYIIDESRQGYDIIANMAVAGVDQDGNTHITITNGISYTSLSSETMARLEHTISIKDEVAQCNDPYTIFKLETSAIKYGERIFYNSQLSSFDSPLVSLKNGEEMFLGSFDLSYFNSDMPNLANAIRMFKECHNLKSFVCDLSSVKGAYAMFALDYPSSEKFTFVSDLSSLADGDDMFKNRHLTEESLMFVADTIKTYTNGIHAIDFGANESLTDTEIELFQEIHEKGWCVYVEGSELTFDATEQTIETGETTSTPKPYYAKPVEVEESKAQFIGEDGKFYRVHGGHYIFVNDPETYGMFTSREDAIANMRLTKYVKQTE